MQPMNAVERYLDDLRGELKVQFGAVDIDRIVEEAASHLLTAIDDAGAETEAEVTAVVSPPLPASTWWTS